MWIREDQRWFADDEPVGEHGKNQQPAGDSEGRNKGVGRLDGIPADHRPKDTCEVANAVLQAGPFPGRFRAGQELGESPVV
jgi:hypothetical protein